MATVRWCRSQRVYPHPHAAGASAALSDSIDLRSRRETCIWEYPIRWLISRWVSPCSRRRPSTCRSSCGSSAQLLASACRSSASSNPSSSVPQHVCKSAVIFAVLRDGRVERGQLVVLAGVDRLNCLLDRASERVGELDDGRRTT